MYKCLSCQSAPCFPIFLFMLQGPSSTTLMMNNRAIPLWTIRDSPGFSGVSRSQVLCWWPLWALAYGKQGVVWPPRRLQSTMPRTAWQRTATVKKNASGFLCRWHPMAGCFCGLLSDGQVKPWLKYEVWDFGAWDIGESIQCPVALDYFLKLKCTSTIELLMHTFTFLLIGSEFVRHAARRENLSQELVEKNDVLLSMGLGTACRLVLPGAVLWGYHGLDGRCWFHGKAYENLDDLGGALV